MKPAVLLMIGIGIVVAIVGSNKVSVPESEPQSTAVPTLAVNDTPPPTHARVAEVIDTITIKLDTGHLVRYIGVRAPDVKEEVRCFGKEALAANEATIGSQVRLEEEPVLLRSRDGAWTRYAWLIQGEVDASPMPSGAVESVEPSPIGEDEKDIFINERILEGGFGFPVVSEQMKYGERLLSAARFASATSKGLWGRCEIEKSADGAPQTVVDESCSIKGVVFGSDTHIYRTRECSAYADTLVLQKSGGRWFCSEDEAQQAGFELAPDC